MAGIRYTMRQNRIKKAFLSGITCKEGDALCSDASGGSSFFVLPMLDSGFTDCQWGRLCFDLKLPENCMCYLYVAASNEKTGSDIMMNPEGSLMDRKRLIQHLRGLYFINKPDVLLYEISGRYLWVMVEIIGEGVEIRNIRVDAPGDNFMETFPEVYRERNSFFHRYLSVFSSIYNDFQNDLDERAELLPIEKAPVKLLEVYARWLGIDVDGGYLGEEVLRNLLFEAPELLRRKGTAFCIERICEIILGEKPVIVERSRVQNYVCRNEKKMYDGLYGESPYDVTLMLKGYVEEKKRGQLLHLLSQFKPIRSKLHITFLEPAGVIDSHSYLDENAVIFTQNGGMLDIAQSADGTIVLQ